uniref:Uncharacterized protein n=1 Tax=Fagus sylvatica TaxID=28930 RepID=A0A2N9EYK2_FAGSY
MARPHLSTARPHLSTARPHLTASLINGAASPHSSCPHFSASPPSLSNSPHTASLSLCDHVSAKKKNKRSKRGGVSLGLGRGSRLGWETNWTKATPWLRTGDATA